MSARAEIAAAMTGTGLVAVTSYYRQNLTPGQGFVKWSGRARGDDQLGYVDTWQVWVALSKSVVDAEQWVETNVETLVEALDAEVIVTTITPAELVLGQNTVNGLILEGARPAE